MREMKTTIFCVRVDKTFTIVIQNLYYLFFLSNLLFSFIKYVDDCIVRFGHALRSIVGLVFYKEKTSFSKTKSIFSLKMGEYYEFIFTQRRNHLFWCALS